MTEKDLLDYGFTRHQPFTGAHYDLEYFYKDTDQRGTRFLVQVKFYMFSVYSRDDYKVDDAWSVEFHMKESEDSSFRVIKTIYDESIEDIVKWGKKVWMRNGAFYYEVKDE